MGKNLKGKTAFIVALLVVFCFGFMGIPHAITPTALKQALADHIHLGLDLKGGIHLELKVNVQEAAGVTNATVSKLDPVAHPEAITVSGVTTANVSRARGILEGTDYNDFDVSTNRSEERRVGKECRSRWSP